MRGRSVGFIILNVVVSAVVALGLIQVLPSGGEGSSIQIATVEILVTTTPDPDGDATRIAFAAQGTVDAQLATFEATALPQVQLPPDVAAQVSGATVDPDTLAANPELESTVSALPDGCVLHEVAEGEAPFTIAEAYGVSGASIMTVNGLTEETATLLQIGDVLIVPLPNCPIEELLAAVGTPAVTEEIVVTEEITEAVTEEVLVAAALTEEVVATEEITEEATEEGTPAATATPTPTRTATPTPTRTPNVAATAVTAQLEIVEFVSPGDITTEGVSILNRGSVVDITDWTLTDAQGNEFVFPEQRLFTNGSITVFTRAGENTPVALFWGRSTAVWGDDGDIATLTDAAGRVQSSVRVAGE